MYLLDATIYVGGLDDKVSETLMWELFVQAGPVGKLLQIIILYSSYKRFTNDLCLPNIDINNFHNCFFSLVNVHMPKDRVTQQHQGYGFVEFLGEEDADYAIKIMNMIKVHGKPIRVNKVRSFLWFMYLII